MAAASGLLNAHSAKWDGDILRAANVSSANLPRLVEHDAVVGRTTSGSVVVNGSGDGFMANIGSGCESSNRIAITLGTSAAVRQMVQAPALDPSAGTFCYRATLGNAFLLGCASNNGGQRTGLGSARVWSSTAGFYSEPGNSCFSAMVEGRTFTGMETRVTAGLAWPKTRSHAGRTSSFGDGRCAFQSGAVCRSD